MKLELTYDNLHVFERAAAPMLPGGRYKSLIEKVAQMAFFEYPMKIRLITVTRWIEHTSPTVMLNFLLQLIPDDEIYNRILQFLGFNSTCDSPVDANSIGVSSQFPVV